jgi:hypothetical protein
MGDENVVANLPRFCAAVANLALLPVAGVSRCKLANTVAQNRTAPRLVVGDPELDLRSQSLEHELAVADKVLDVLLLVQQTSVPVVQSLRQVPMEKSDHGLYTVGQQLIDQIDVVLQALVIDRIVTATEWNHSRPRNTESVCLGSERFQKSYIGLVDVVRVASNLAARTVCDFARNSAEGIPNGVSTTVLLSSAFDLVAVLRSARSGTTSIELLYLTLR